MFFSRNDTASCRSPIRRWVCFTVEPAEILLVSQSETSSDFAEFPESPSRVLGCGKWFLLRMSPLFSPLPPPGLWNIVIPQQILCNSFLGICQIPLPTKAGLNVLPSAEQSPCSSLVPNFSVVLVPTKIWLKWTSTEWVLV